MTSMSDSQTYEGYNFEVSGSTRPTRPTVATTEEPNTATTQAAPVTTEHLVTTGPTRPTRPTVTTDVPVSTRPVATTTTEEIASIQADSDTTDAPTEGTTELINNYS